LPLNLIEPNSLIPRYHPFEQISYEVKENTPGWSKSKNVRSKLSVGTYFICWQKEVEF
jgi:hypothetical protein